MTVEQIQEFPEGVLHFDPVELTKEEKIAALKRSEVLLSDNERQRISFEETQQGLEGQVSIRLKLRKLLDMFNG